MRERINQLLNNSELGVKERLFRVIIVMGEVVALLVIVESFFINIGLMLVPLVALAVVMGIAGLFTFKYHCVDVASVVVGVVLSGIIFPVMFLGSGGIEGGSSIWFVLGIFYDFVLFDGVVLYLFLGFNFLCIAATYVLGYLHPDWIFAFTQRAKVFSDSFFAIIAVGIVCGIIIRYQIRLYAKERELVQHQKEELEKLNQAQNAFFASMSHEIRTPINTVIGLNEMILRSQPSDEIAGYAQNVQVSSKMLLNLVNDILDISQITQNKMEIIPAKYYTEELFSEIVDMMWIQMEEKKLVFLVEISPELPVALFGDEKRIQQILINLLNNALKYTNEGYVRLSAKGERSEDGYVTLKISVQDTGIGIRKEDLDGLYDSFHRVDAQKNAKIEGSGLGLAITKNLLALMGGTISVDSIYTKGTIFTIYLKQKIENSNYIGDIDFKQRRRMANGNYYEQSFEAPEARVLVVDDNDANAFVVQKLLEATKVQIDIAKNGMECLQMTQKKFYHIILMDYMMPEMNGIETFQALRKQENSLCRNSAVILVTASGSAEALKAEYGFEGCLDKPIVADQLESEILQNLPKDIIEYCADEDYTEGQQIEYSVSFRKKKRICITTDCVCDLPEELLEKYEIKVMYLYIRTEHGRFADTYEIDSDNLAYYLLEHPESVRADSVSVEEYENFFADTLNEAEEIIHISMAEKSGKSYGVAVAASKCFDHVHVVDSGHISGAEGLVVLYAAMLVREGRKVDTILSLIEEKKGKVNNRFLLSGVQTFYQNGYTNRITAGICKMIHAHPVLSIVNSRIFVSGALIGKFPNVWRRFVRFTLHTRNHISDEIVIVTYVGLTVKEREFLRKEIEKCMSFQQVLFQKASFSNSCNAGMPSVGIAFYRR